MCGRRKHARRLVAALIAGIMLTVVIAWLAMFLPWDGQHWYGPPADQTLGVVSRSDGAKTFQVSRGRNAWHAVTSYWWMQISGFSITMTGDHPDYRDIDLGALPAHMRPESADDLNMLSWYHATGWPLPAMTCGVHWEQQILNSNVIYSVSGGLQLPRDADFNPRALPLTPLWPGFAVDSLLFAAAVWLALWLAGAAQRWHRTRRNRCVACGYPRRGLPAEARCPECGEPVSG